MSIDQRIVEATEQLEADVQLTHNIVNGDENTEVQTEGGPVPTHAKVAKDTNEEIMALVDSTIGDIDDHAQFVEQKATESAQSASRAEAAADRAEEISGIEDVQEALRLAAVPAPDFHLPLISDLRIQEGFGPPDQIDVSPEQDGSVMVDLPTRSASFGRASEKWYTNKSGVLTKAEINEPAFEKKGIALHDGSTNVCTNSNELQGSGAMTLTPARGPDGVEGSAWLCVDDDSQAEGYVSREPHVDIAHGSPLSISMYVKQHEANFINIRPIIQYESVNENSRYNYDFAANAFQSGAPNWLFAEADILNDGWRRLRIGIDTTLEDGDISRLLIRINTERNSGHSFYTCGFQAEQLPVVTPYIPTGDMPVTRVADDLKAARLNNIPRNGSSITVSYTLDCAHAESIRPFRTTSSSGLGVGNTGHGGRDFRGFLYDSTPVIHSFSETGKANKGIQTITYDNESHLLSLFYDGVHLKSQDIGAINTTDLLGKIQIGAGNMMTDIINGYIRDFKIWHRALTPEQISALGAAQ